MTGSRKRCIECGRQKPLDAFYRVWTLWGERRQSRCKPCKGRASARPESTASTLATILAPEPPPPSTPPVDPPAPAVAAALAAIAELIAEPERWCQGCSARDAQGRPTVPGSVGAARLSAFGAFALLRFDGRLSNADALRLWLVLDGATPDGRRFARWHDDQRTTHAEVLALLKRARGEP